MYYYIINKRLIKACRLPTALHKFGQIVEKENGEPQIGLDCSIQVKRLNKSEYEARGGK